MSSDSPTVPVLGHGAAPAVQGAGLGRAWRALAVLWLVHAIANIDRFSVGLVAQSIKTDLGLSDTQIGLFTGAAFVVAYVIVGFPMARWLDRGHRARILAWALAFWSVTTMACGAVSNFVQLIIARAGVGAGESACVPGALSLITDYFPREKRAQALGIFQSALPAAGIVGTPAIGWVADHHGWRAALFAMGLAGVLLAGVVAFALRDPVRGASAGGAAGAEGPAVALALAPAGLWADLRTMFAIKPFRYLMLAHGLYGIGIFSFVTWYPISLVRGHGLSYTELGLYAGTGLGIVMFLTSLASGYLGSRVVVRTGNERWLANLPALFCLASVPALAFACADVSVGVAMAAGGVAFAMTMARTPLIATLATNLLPASIRSTGMLVLLLASNVVGSAIGPLIAGMISDALMPSLGGVVALRHALLWTAPPLCALGALVGFVPARYMTREGGAVN
jgi:MFS family permease